jgi:hypothetical protein
MSKRYTGNFISGTPQVPTLSSNNGIFDTNDVYTAVSNGTWQEPDGVYEIGKSLRFRAASTTYFNRTPSTASNRTTWTWSGWVKRGSAGGPNVFTLFFAESGGNTNARIEYLASGQFRWFYQVSGVDTAGTTSNALYRDYSAWYHVVYVYDSTQANAGNRQTLYVNGVIATNASVIAPAQNTATSINNTVTHWLGRNNSPEYFDGYMAEVNFVDGQALDPSYFGYFDPVTNIWQPKKYTGAYGINGFYLPFSENFSTTNLGRNFAGSNHFTYSQAGTDASYVYNNASGTANFTTAPDGTSTATKLTIDSSNTSHRFYKQYTVLTSGAVAVVSAYVKALPGSAYNVVALENWTGSAGGQAYFNLTTGQPQYAAAWPAGSGFQYVGDGWYRIWTTFANATSNGSGTPSIGIYMVDNSNGLTYTGNGTAGFYFWGVQVNLGTTPDNYIATTSTASINNFTPNNFSVTAGTTYDSVTDSPTNVFLGNVTDTGGVIPGNYPTFNPLDIDYGGGTAPSFSNGNLTTSFASSGYTYVQTTFSKANVAFASNYLIDNIGFEFYVNAIGAYSYGVSVQLCGKEVRTDGFPYTTTTFTTGDYIQCTYSAASNGTVRFYKNGTLMTNGTFTSCGDFLMPRIVMQGSGASVSMNAGQQPWKYPTPFVGFRGICTTTLQAYGTSLVGKPAIQPNKWFDTVLYGGTGQARTITNPGGFVPDLVWTKSRSNTYSYNITDSVRGAGIRSYSDGTAVEAAIPNGGVTSFNTISNNGYDINGGVEVNELGKTYVSWQWKQSPTAGFNIITYTGDGTSNRAISHNLGVTPGFQIVKARSGGNAGSSQWIIHHQSQATGYTHYFNSGLPADSGTYQWGTSAATSSNFYVGWYAGATGSNENGTLYVAYLWAEVPGFSRFGSYAGNTSADGPFMYCGFRPRWITIRSTTAAREWNVWDTARGPYNINNAGQLNLGDAHAEYTTTGYNDVVDFLSNGFKLRSAGSPNYNQGETYLWAAFAESPFVLNNRAR